MVIQSESGANVNIINHEGYTALLLAENNGFVETARSLVEKGADVGIAGKDGSTPLTLAAKKGLMSVIRVHFRCYLQGQGRRGLLDLTFSQARCEVLTSKT